MQQIENQKSLSIKRYGPKWLWAEMVWAEMVMGRNGHGPKWLWAEMTRNRWFYIFDGGIQKVCPSVNYQPDDYWKFLRTRLERSKRLSDHDAFV